MRDRNAVTPIKHKQNKPHILKALINTMGNDNSSPVNNEDDPAREALKEIPEVIGDEELDDKEQPSTEDPDKPPMLIPEAPVKSKEEPLPELFDWDSVTVERQAEHYLFLLGMILAFSEIGDVIAENRSMSQTLTDLVKALPPVVAAKDLINIAVSTENEELLFEKDGKYAERPYPRK